MHRTKGNQSKMAGQHESKIVYCYEMVSGGEGGGWIGRGREML
jgi:hypothetical protein